MALTYRIEANETIVVWIDRDGHQILRQPHHPQAYMNAPWDSVEEAENWAISKIAELEAEQQLIQTQQEKLDRILELLEAKEA